MMKLGLPLFTGNAFDGIQLHNLRKQPVPLHLYKHMWIGLHLTLDNSRLARSLGARLILKIVVDIH